MIGIVHVHIDAKMREKRHNSPVVLCYGSCLDSNKEIKISKAHFVTILGRPFTLSLILKPIKLNLNQLNLGKLCKI